MDKIALSKDIANLAVIAVTRKYAAQALTNNFNLTPFQLEVGAGAAALTVGHATRKHTDVVVERVAKLLRKND